MKLKTTLQESNIQKETSFKTKFVIKMSQIVSLMFATDWQMSACDSAPVVVCNLLECPLSSHDKAED